MRKYASTRFKEQEPGEIAVRQHWEARGRGGGEGDQEQGAKCLKLDFKKTKPATPARANNGVAS